MSLIKSLMTLKSNVKTLPSLKNAVASLVPVFNQKGRENVETGAKSFGREKFGAKKEPKANADVISGGERVTLNCLQLSHTLIHEALRSPIFKLRLIIESLYESKWI